MSWFYVWVAVAAVGIALILTSLGYYDGGMMFFAGWMASSAHWESEWRQ